MTIFDVHYSKYLYAYQPCKKGILGKEYGKYVYYIRTDNVNKNEGTTKCFVVPSVIKKYLKEIFCHSEVVSDIY